MLWLYIMSNYGFKLASFLIQLNNKYSLNGLIFWEERCGNNLFFHSPYEIWTYISYYKVFALGGIFVTSRSDAPPLLELFVNDAVLKKELLLKYVIALWFLAQKFLRKRFLKPAGFFQLYEMRRKWCAS